ncbi:hypothetical protein ACWEGQ_08250 [Streptomyces seoulensis]
MDLKKLQAIHPSEYADAADGYRAISDMADAAKGRIDKQITKAMQQANEGEAANAAQQQLTKLSQNFHYTQTECGLISGALTGFSSEIAAPHRRLLEALDDAKALSYTVHANGGVTYSAGGENEQTGEKIVGGTVTGFNGIYSRGPGPDMTGLRSPNPNRAKAQDIADRIAHAVHPYRSDAESGHAQLDASLWNGRLISYGVEAQQLLTLGFVLAQNSTSRALHEEGAPTLRPTA